MGSFYTNVTVIGIEEEAVASACPRPAFIASEGPVVTVFAEADEDGIDEETSGALSAALSCITLTVSVHDSDLLSFQVFSSGELVSAGFVPDPAELFGGEPGDLIGGPGSPDAEQVVAALGQGNVDEVRAAFEEDFVFAEERHEALLRALRLPLASARWGYRYLMQDDESPGRPAVRHLGVA